MKSSEVTQSISQHLEDMRKSERKVAEYVLENTHEVIHMRIVDLANVAGVSEPTVVRFCRAAGFSGFQEFKLSLAQEIAAAPAFGNFPIAGTDSVGSMSHKVIDKTIDALVQVRDRINSAKLKSAISALSEANRVEFFGFGASGAVASDAHHKFFRLKVASAAYSDHHYQHMSAVSMEPGDVMVAISQSGRTKALLESTELVKQRGATVISISASNSPLSTAATINVDVDVNEKQEVYTPLTSRIAHLMIIDILAIGVAQSHGQNLDEHLFRLKKSLTLLKI